MVSVNSEVSSLSLETILEDIAVITLQVQQRRDLEDILQSAIDRARILLQVDRVFIYYFLTDEDAVITFESVDADLPSIIGQRIHDPCLKKLWVEQGQQDHLKTLSDIHTAHPPTCCTEQLSHLQVQANLAIPILNQGDLWGLLIVHHCHSTHEWQPLEVHYLQLVALQLGVVVQQADLRQSYQSKLTELEQHPIVVANPDNHSETQLRHYERIVSATPDCVSLIDRNYIYQVVNQTYLAWNQKSYDEIVGHSVSDLLGQEFFEMFSKPRLDRCLAGEPQQNFEIWQDYADGQRRYIKATYTPYVEMDGTISGVVINVHDLTELKLVEEALRLQSTALEACADMIMITDRQGMIEWANPAFTKVTGYSLEEVIGKNPRELVRSGKHRAEFYRNLWNTILSGKTWRGEMINRRKDGSFYIEFATITPVKTPQGEIHHFAAIKQDITERKQIELATQQQAERERMIQAMTGRIRQSLELSQILHTTVTEVRQVLATDRVLIYRLNPDWSGVVIAESVADNSQSILGMEITDTCFVETQGQVLLQGNIGAIDDIYNAGLTDCHIKLLERFQVRANLAVPILQDNHLWGLLVAHHCQEPRQWQPFEIALKQQLATQIAIAIQQSELYSQVRGLNANLELQVQERTAQLQQALDFEALLKRITDRVRDSLDESQILQTAVQELSIELNMECCDAALYDLEHRTATISYEYLRSQVAPAKGLVFNMDTSYGIHDQLLQGQCIQFCLTALRSDSYRSTIDHRTAILACPFHDEQGVLGDLWLFKPQQEYFSEAEVRLVQQVANQCAIALRQSRLYQTAQAQVQELERLSRLKDDFLSTVSHELRTPMSNIKMATQMLEISLNRLGVLDDDSSPVNRYFNVLREEGQREISLINDLLDLARLDAGTEPLRLTDVDLTSYIPHLAETFIERMRQQQQQFVLQISEDLPSITTDLPYLERILSELLHNACKYTPAEGTITVSTQPRSESLEICVCNSGVEISAIERDRIFDKFYRIPNNDPWKHGGTGLGLALVKKLVEQIGGTIEVESTNNQTCFRVQLPLQVEPDQTSTLKPVSFPWEY